MCQHKLEWTFLKRYSVASGLSDVWMWYYTHGIVSFSVVCAKLAYLRGWTISLQQNVCGTFIKPFCNHITKRRENSTWSLQIPVVISVRWDDIVKVVPIWNSTTLTVWSFKYVELNLDLFVTWKQQLQFSFALYAQILNLGYHSHMNTNFLIALMEELSSTVSSA